MNTTIAPLMLLEQSYVDNLHLKILHLQQQLNKHTQATTNPIVQTPNDPPARPAKQPSPARGPTAYGLATAPPSLRARTAQLAHFTPKFTGADLMRAFPRALYRQLFGGRSHWARVSTGPRARETGHASLLYLKPALQPYAPARPGAVGIYLNAVPRGADWPAHETVLVGTRSSLFLYVGEYALVGGAPLAAQEVCALPRETVEFWAQHIWDVKGCADVRTRVWFRKTWRAEPTKEQVRRMVHCVDSLSLRDIVDALRRGEEKLYAWGMQPKWYEASLQEMLIREDEKPAAATAPEKCRKRKSCDMEDDAYDGDPSPDYNPRVRKMDARRVWK
ncbi:hypothetical protein BV25DRAFT_1915487 [Artomyces pyxidatus]|uniref:Uncharacterized protein n=1 Tax=Artomyces pyxidatus TaxID=48021 RepID=A0ACB8T333_9AGAM|nr:hypothetical protein BV25DRAFT_1915487 [Artomyces pyxidatus]